MKTQTQAVVSQTHSGAVQARVAQESELEWFEGLLCAAALALRDSLRKKRGKLMITREDASAIGSLIKAWESCQERIRIHRNKPMPGVLRAEPKPRRKRLPVAAGCPAPELSSLPQAGAP